MDTQKFEKAVEHFKIELGSLRTGRASAALVDAISAEVYGAMTPLAHIASVSTPDAKTVAIQPWDKSNLGAIEKAIVASNIGLNPVNDGVLIRLSVPPMTEERRKEMVKVMGQLAEQAKIAIRAVREEELKTLKAQEENNEITQDDLEAQKADLQKVVDSYNDKIKELAAAKEKEVMTI